jgi:L-lactate dehydrogenase complex protein LldG
MLRHVRSAIEPTPSAVPVPRAYRQGSELDPQAVVECFAGRVDDYRATVTQAGPTSLPSRLAELLANAEHVGVPAGPPRAGSVTATRDGSLTTDALDLLEALVTGCALAIAETGTIILDGSRSKVVERSHSCPTTTSVSYPRIASSDRCRRDLQNCSRHGRSR